MKLLFWRQHHSLDMCFILCYILYYALYYIVLYTVRGPIYLLVLHKIQNNYENHSFDNKCFIIFVLDVTA